MKEELQTASTTRRYGVLGVALRIALGFWLLAGMAWAMIAGDFFQIAKGSRPAVATDDLGNQVIVFEAADGGLRGQLRDASGRAVGIEFKVSADDDAIKPEVAVLSSGEFIVAWEDGDDDETAIVARRFDASGRAVGIELLLGAWGHDPAIGVDDRGVAVAAWTAPADTEAREFVHVLRRFDASGRAVGIELQLGRPGPATAPALAVQNAGRFLVVWEDHRGDVVAQAFDVDGAPLGDVFRVNESRSGEQGSPAATAALDGDYTVVWERVLSGSKERQVVGRRVAASGRAVGIEFRISQSRSEKPTSPTVMADRNGKTMAIWVSRQDVDRVLAREVSLDGRAVGIEFLIDARTTAHSARASRGGHTADFFVVWDGSEGADESYVYGRDLMLDSDDDSDDDSDSDSDDD